MKILLFLALAIVATRAINYDAEWEKFKLKYDKSYYRSEAEVSHFWYSLDENDFY